MYLGSNSLNSAYLDGRGILPVDDTGHSQIAVRAFSGRRRLPIG